MALSSVLTLTTTCGSDEVKELGYIYITQWYIAS